jgi:hypothetical protein
MPVKYVYKIIFDEYIYVFDLTEITNFYSIANNKISEKSNLFIYFKDRKDPIVISNIPTEYVLDFYTVFDKFKKEHADSQKITFTPF